MNSTYYVAGIPFSSNGSLSHHGIKGQKWGIRRWQNPDGTLTEAGKKHYYGDKNIELGSKFISSKAKDRLNKITEKEFNKAYKATAREDRHSKYGAREGRPNEIKAAFRTRARQEIKNTREIIEAKKELIESLKPELEFETNHDLWKKYGYDPDNPNFETVHDAENDYYDAKEKYLSDLGLGKGTDKRKAYDKDRSWAFEKYNMQVDYAINDMLGYSGNIPVYVVSRWNNKYYSVAREAIAKSLQYGSYADPHVLREGALDFWSLADEYAEMKKEDK